MRKLSVVAALIILAGCILASCGGRSYKSYTIDPNYEPSIDVESNISVQDFDGELMTLPADIKSVTCFSPEAGKIIAAIGNAKYIKAVDEATKQVVSVINVIDAEQINEQDNELIFISESYDTSIITSDVPYVAVPQTLTIADTITLIKMIEKIFNSAQDSLADAIDMQMNRASQATNEYMNKYPVFIDLGVNEDGTFTTPGAGSFINEILGVSGGENIFAGKEADENGNVTVTKEEVLAAKPEFIFTASNLRTFLRDNDFRELDCVSGNRVYQIDPENYKYACQTIAADIDEIFTYINEYHISQLSN